MTPQETLGQAALWLDVNVARSAPFKERIASSETDVDKLKIYLEAANQRKKRPAALCLWIQEAIEELS